MRFNHFQEIVDKICERMRCSQCEGLFRMADIHVANASNNHIQFCALCPECRTQSNISADIQSKKTHVRRVPVSAQRRPMPLTRESVQGIGKMLKGFQGQRIEDLFAR